jgi:RNA polymerase sigma-54 factor
MAAISFRQTTGQRQEQQLTARMLPALAILELPSMELSSYLREAFESNEALTLEEPRRTQDSPDAPQTAAEAARDGSLDRTLDGGADTDLFEPTRMKRGSAEATDRHAEWLESQPAPGRSFGESLLEQLAFVDFRGLEPDAECSLKLQTITHFLVEELDERGLLLQTDEQLFASAVQLGLDFGPDPERALAAGLNILRGFSPLGVGARSAVEALLFQVDPEDEDFVLLHRLLIDFLEELSRNKLPKIAASIGIEVDEVVRLLGRLSQLDARKAEQHEATSGRLAPAIHPDVIVEEESGSFSVLVDGAIMPKVGIDEDIRALAKDRTQDSELRSYLRAKIDSARLVVDAVEQRRTTLLRVSRALFAHQRAFLEHGPGHLTPLRMATLAHVVGIHRSTVSRAIAGKYAWTPWGVLPLRHFFQGAAGDSEVTARGDVREIVRSVVEAEEPAAPLSDEDIVLAMGARGFSLARRTVAKYRRELGIPSSYLRRCYTS